MVELKSLIALIALLLSFGVGIVVGYSNGYYDGYYHGYDGGEIWDSGYSDGYVTAFEINDKDKWISKITYIYHYNNSVWFGWHGEAEDSYNLIIERGK